MIRRPLDGNPTVTQTFGVNREYYFTRWGMEGHNGTDYGVWTGTSVKAPHDGRVIEAGFSEVGYGYYVKLENSVEGSVLAHLSRINVTVGQWVLQGQEVALSGNTGHSTGPHLHWGYYRIPRNRRNGFDGFIAPWPYMVEYVSKPQPQPVVDQRPSIPVVPEPAPLQPVIPIIQPVDTPIAPSFLDEPQGEQMLDRPEYELTFVTLKNEDGQEVVEDKITQQDSHSFDLTGQTPPKSVAKGSRIKVAGFLRCNGIEYVRDENGVKSNTWRVLPVEAFDEPSGQPPAQPIPVSVEPSRDEAVLPPETASFFRRVVFAAAGPVLRFLGKRISKQEA